MKKIVIVGGGQAAGQAAASLCQKKFDGKITIIGNENSLPYQRPPLSKQYLAGNFEREHLLIRQAEFYESRNVSVRSGVTVTAIDPGKKTLTTDKDDAVRFDKLLLATGARPKRLDVPGVSLAGIHYLRSVADVDRIRAQLPGAKHLCVVGGGYIGLEVAAVAISAGLEVTVIEAEERVLRRVATPELSAFYRNLHESHGVSIYVNAQVTGFAGDGAVSAVCCGDDEFPADLVIVGIGIEPNVELAAAAGLACDNGISVDEYCRTSSADIFAAGDCTHHPSPQLQRRLRLESVPNALDQGRVAAVNMLGGNDIHDAVPWFWSDQYGLKLQMVGFAADGEFQILRGDVDANKFAVFHLADGAIVAVDAVNDPQSFMIGKRLFGKEVDRAILEDQSADLRALLKK
ncbi:MAG: FAD-dependent oxidoreductase [Woeseia sp.]|nr:FAD-dependent oxidoreductase [Woeseia sp.]